MKVLGIDIGIGIFNTFQMGKSIEVLGIQQNFFGILVLGIQYFKKVLTHTLYIALIVSFEEEENRTQVFGWRTKAQII